MKINYIETYSPLGTVSYPKKFGDLKFPIFDLSLYIPENNKTFNYTYIMHPIDTSLKILYNKWCAEYALRIIHN
jgi:hypothetical protein